MGRVNVTYSPEVLRNLHGSGHVPPHNTPCPACHGNLSVNETHTSFVRYECNNCRMGFCEKWFGEDHECGCRAYMVQHISVACARCESEPDVAERAWDAIKSARATQQYDQERIRVVPQTVNAYVTRYKGISGVILRLQEDDMTRCRKLEECQTAIAQLVNVDDDSRQALTRLRTRESKQLDNLKVTRMRLNKAQAKFERMVKDFDILIPQIRCLPGPEHRIVLDSLPAPILLRYNAHK